jgi:Bax protein
MVFNRGLLALVTGLIALLIGAAAMNPPQGLASAPTGGANAFLSDDAAAGLDTGLRPASGPLVPASVDHLTRVFKRADFNLGDVAQGKEPVPRVFVKRLPGDLSNLREVEARKDVFFKALLPLVLKVNEELRTDRRRLWSIKSKKRLGRKLGAVDRLWLIVMTERYHVKRGDIDALLDRVDVVPPSLALAQAAEESGWGTSRFVRQGNALFGQWTWSGDGIAPLERADGKTHKIKAFSSLLESVRAYALNLNTHRAYKRLRRARARMRASGALDGYALAGYLDKYSERGDAYVETLRTIMDANQLRRFEGAELASL